MVSLLGDDEGDWLEAFTLVLVLVLVLVFVPVVTAVFAVGSFVLAGVRAAATSVLLVGHAGVVDEVCWLGGLWTDHVGCGCGALNRFSVGLGG